MRIGLSMVFGVGIGADNPLPIIFVNQRPPMFSRLIHYLRPDENRGQMLLNCPLKARDPLIDVGIGFDASAIKVQLFSPDQSCCNTQLHNTFEELLKDADPIALANAAQRTMVGHAFAQILTNVPAVGQIHTNLFH